MFLLLFILIITLGIIYICMKMCIYCIQIITVYNDDDEINYSIDEVEQSLLHNLNYISDDD
jgi:hypothetical protein